MAYIDGANIVVKGYAETDNSGKLFQAIDAISGVQLISTEYKNNMLRCKFSRTKEVLAVDEDFMTALTGAVYSRYEFGGAVSGQSFVTDDQVNVGVITTTVSFLYYIWRHKIKSYHAAYFQFLTFQESDKKSACSTNL